MVPLDRCPCHWPCPFCSTLHGTAGLSMVPYVSLEHLSKVLHHHENKRPSPWASAHSCSFLQPQSSGGPFSARVILKSHCLKTPVPLNLLCHSWPLTSHMLGYLPLILCQTAQALSRKHSLISWDLSSHWTELRLLPSPRPLPEVPLCSRSCLRLHGT